MTENLRFPSVDALAKRSKLTHTAHLAEFAKQEPQFLRSVYADYNKLISRFNSLQSTDPNLSLMPGVQNLKQKLGTDNLPNLPQLDARSYYTGVTEALPLMRLGQQRRETNQTLPPESIGSASLTTSDHALIVGIFGHIMERTIFNYFRRRGITEWNKDDVLFALEDLALLSRAEYQNNRGEMSDLYLYMANPATEGWQGGLGWRTREQVHNFTQAYEELHGIS